MDSNKARELAAALREHNAWRRGEGKYDGEPSFEPMPYEPKHLCEILDQSATALEAYAHQAEVCGEWQPIETAPKDGTSIIVGAPKDKPHYGDVDQVRYEEVFGHGAWLSIGGKADCGNYLDYMPTHWIPLPTPPKESKTDA